MPVALVVRSEPDGTSAQPSTLEWLASARNFVEFANRAEQYDEVERFLRSREAKKIRELHDG